MTENQDDRGLVRSLLAGERAAFDGFFHEYFPRLYRFVLPRVGGDAAVAEDLCQNVLTRALRKLHLYRGEAALFTWLCRIARNELADHWQQRQREQNHLVFLQDDAAIQAVLDTLETDDRESPEAGRFGQEVGRLVQLALDNLPGRYGSLLEWKYVDGLSMTEIAQRSDMTVVSVQSALQRARSAFREAFVTLAGGSIDDILRTAPTQPGEL